MTPTTLNFMTKLRRLESQIHSALLADYAYHDGESALKALLVKTRSTLSRVEDSEGYSPSIRNSVLRDANFLIMRSTYIIGIIIRSTSNRNPFELYVPFLNICKSFLGAECHLILASEWQYIPFTHPQNLQELPGFVIIGMPASESDNALVFPVAGHELGHSIWAKNDYRSSLREVITKDVEAIIIGDRESISHTFPEVRNADFDQDMFVQYIKSTVFRNSMSQCEEIFSDFIGLLLFGEGYVYAFEFLVAPQLGGVRSNDYPDMKIRANILETYTHDKLGINISGYSDSFLADQRPPTPQSACLLELSDKVTETQVGRIYDLAKQCVEKTLLRLPNTEQTFVVEEAFRAGIPYDGDATLGDCINAAWHMFRDMKNIDRSEQKRRSEEVLTDLVMKSAELHELRAYMP